MPRAAFVAVLSCAFLSSVAPSCAECLSLPPASERAGYWQYRIVHGKRCWFGPLKADARAHASIIRPMRLGARPKSVRAPTRIHQLAKPTGTVTLPPLPREESDDVWPEPEPNFEQRFEAVYGR